MPWAKPHGSKNELYRAGRSIAQSPPDVEGLKFVEHWRLCHALPLVMIRSILSEDTMNCTVGGGVTGRLKRMASIQGKLQRRDVNDLSNMQDIAGCRAIVPSVDYVRNLEHALKKRGCDAKFTDYISKPRNTGYRGIHVIAEYKGRNRHEHDGLKVEIQLRTILQHRWSTAVETITFLKSYGDLKSGRGNPDWLKFLSLMADAYAIGDEQGVLVGSVAIPNAMKQSIAALEQKLNVQQVLSGIEMAAELAADRTPLKLEPNERYGFLIVQEDSRTVSVTTYSLAHLEQAGLAYAEAEIVGRNAVLVFVDDLKMLLEGYPSYFHDIKAFRQNVIHCSHSGSYVV